MTIYGEGFIGFGMLLEAVRRNHKRWAIKSFIVNYWTTACVQDEGLPRHLREVGDCYCRGRYTYISHDQAMVNILRALDETLTYNVWCRHSRRYPHRLAVPSYRRPARRGRKKKNRRFRERGYKGDTHMDNLRESNPMKE